MSTIEIQVVDENQTKILRPLMRQGFGVFGNLMAFDVGKHTLIAKQGETLLGAIVCGEIKHGKDKKKGIVKYIMTDPKAQGLGVASELMDEAMNWFESQGHDEIVACVEGYNTASSQLFLKRGFKLRSFFWQFKKYRLKLPWIWLQGNHGLDLGHFWWTKRLKKEDVPASSYKSSKAFLSHLLLSFFFPALFMLRSTDIDGWTILWQAPLVVMSIFAFRFLPMILYSWWIKYPVRYRGWDNGHLLALLITGVFGGMFLSFGGLYPRKEGWREDQERPSLAKMHLWGLLGMHLLAFISILLYAFASVEIPWRGFVNVLLTYSVFMTLFDTLFAFFPVNSMAGGRLRVYHPKVWWGFAFLAITWFVLGFFI